MMMKNLIKTLGFILAIAGPSVVMAAPSTEQPDTISENIPNTACIERPGNHKQCSTAVISPYTCLSISSNGTTVEINEQNQGKMKFTCEASDNTKPHNFYISCGNGDYSGGYKAAGQSFSYTCKYGENDLGQSFNVACFVDGHTPYELQNTNPACIRNIDVGNLITLNVCGDGILSGNEECDLWYKPSQVEGHPKKIGEYLDTTNLYESNGYKGMYCQSCKIVGLTGYVYQPAECLKVDTPISVMNNEFVPYRRSLYIKDAEVGSQNACAGYNGTKTLLNKDTMECYFNVYNGNHNESGNPIQTFHQKCYSGNTNANIYQYFNAIHQTQNNIAGAAINSILSLTNTVAEDEFGEYKLVLEKVEYQYCNTDTHKRTTGKRYGAICQVNFAVTRPYVMHISTFGVSPIGVTDRDFLYDYFDMQGNSLLNKTDLAKTMDISYSDYENEDNLESEIQAFQNKYEKLAVTVKSTSTIKKNNSTKTLSQIFGENVTIRKVPNQHIYFIESNGSEKIILKQNNIEFLGSAYTIFVKGMDVVIEGNVLQYAMIITDINHKIYFKDGGSEVYYSSCASGGQVVQGLFIAGGGFRGSDSLRNQNVTDYWCPWGGLHVKGVLIGEGIEELMNSKRSQLNSWFNIYTNNANRERREKIIGGAAVLIEYNPSLWKTLPPGAEIFTESLEVYRK